MCGWLASLRGARRARPYPVVSRPDWRRRQARDRYVRSAAQAGYRSRASYKLLELDRVERLLRPGLWVLELGAAPGGWTQVAARRIGPKGRLVAVDRLPLSGVPGTVVVQGDLGDAAVLGRIDAALEGRPVDLLLSDMAPNITGTALRDQAAAAGLLHLALTACERHLQRGGHAVVKAFEGEDFTDIKRQYAARFGRLRIRKPAASRARSRECYLVCRDFGMAPGPGHGPGRAAVE